MLKAQHINVLLAIEEAGSIRGASKTLGKSQPAVTKALKSAESDIGARVFVRAPNGVAVTQEGQPVLRRAKIVQAELKKMQEEIAQNRGEGTGNISITVSPLAAHRIISPAIQRFKRRFPRVNLQISAGQEPYAFGPVRDGTVDMVIGPQPNKAEAVGLNVKFLVETPITVISGVGSKWAKSQDLAELAAGDWIMIGTRARLPFLRNRFVACGVTPPEPSITADSISSVLSIIEGSDFLCTFPQLLVPTSERKWKILDLNVADQLLPARIALTTSSETPPTPALQHFFDCVEQAARDEFG